MLAATLFLVALTCQLVQATIFITAPSKDVSCLGGQPCTVQWLDDGSVPNLNEIGPCHVGLYNGHQVLVQQIPPVNVAAELSLVFTPDPLAGPDSGTYYINFTSVDPVGHSSQTYSQFSHFFKLTNMAGSFDTPVPSDTSSLVVPSSVASGTTNAILTTILVTPVQTPSPPLSMVPTITSSIISPSGSHTLSLSFSAASSIPSAIPPSSIISTSATGSSIGSSSSISTPNSATISTTPSVTPSPTLSGTTLTVSPASSGFTASRAPPSISSPALNPTNLPSPSDVSAGTMDGKPTLHALSFFSIFSASILFGWRFF